MPKEIQHIRLKASMPRIFLAINGRTVPAISMGLDMIYNSIEKIAEEAKKIGNHKIIQELYYMDMIELNEFEKKEYIEEPRTELVS